MQNLIIRTEDIKLEHILELYVESSQDKKIIDLLKSSTPTVMEGSRGTGKSFLLRVAEGQLLQRYPQDHILPVYVSFVKSSLIQSDDPNQFLHWMLAKLCSRILRALYQKGLLVHSSPTISLLAGGDNALEYNQTHLEKISQEYEESYKHPGLVIDSSKVPNVDDLKDAIEDICIDVGIERFSIFFDEAAHIFRPEQQRQFFTMFRDLRSPYLSCNAAVYPGVTFYGQTFQSTHDATVISLNRDLLEQNYLEGMREIVSKQADAQLKADIERNRENFHSLAYAVCGNPRLLLKTVSMAPKLGSNDVTKVLKEFYRTDIWAEHSGLAYKYVGHRALIDWGREFIDKFVIPDSNQKNELYAQEGKNESTCYFWIHRDAPESINEALRLLSYTGIVTLLDTGVVASRSELGTRYAVNLGCLVSSSASPVATLTRIGRTLTKKRFTEYGANHSSFISLISTVGNYKESDISSVLAIELSKSIDVLDLTDYQKSGLISIGLDTIGKALKANEQEFQRIDYIGPKRSRKIMNIVTASILEFLSG